MHRLPYRYQVKVELRLPGWLFRESREPSTEHCRAGNRFVTVGTLLKVVCSLLLASDHEFHSIPSVIRSRSRPILTRHCQARSCSCPLSERMPIYAFLQTNYDTLAWIRSVDRCFTSPIFMPGPCFNGGPLVMFSSACVA